MSAEAMQTENSTDTTSLTALTRWQKIWQWLDTTGETWGDSFNPIVVKEARQSLKSRHFIVTFSLLLLCGAFWSMGGVVYNFADIFYRPSGAELARGFYLILCIPMLLIVPFVAYRSISAEMEDGTYELLSITALASRQIVWGKLVSALLQIMLYYSALAPCIVFTYLLKGIDIITIALFLGWLLVGSLLLCSFSLAVGTLTRNRQWQVFVSVVLLAGLFIILYTWLGLSAEIFEDLARSAPYERQEFWMLSLALLSFCISFVVMFLFFAAGQLSFATDNRSTAIRWVIVFQGTLFHAWSVYPAAHSLLHSDQRSFYFDNEFFILVYIAPLVYSWLIGALLVGEWSELSPRVRRQLPQTYLGKMFLTWLNPGSGTGYVFTLVNYAFSLFMLVGMGLSFLIVESFMRGNRMGAFPGGIESYLFGIGVFLFAGFAYMATFLGLGRLITMAVRHRVPNTVYFSFLIQIVLVAFSALIPLFIQQFTFTTMRDHYTVLQCSDPFWTLFELAKVIGPDNRWNGNGFGYNFGYGVYDTKIFHLALSIILVSTFAVVIICLNLFLAARELTVGFTATPQRIRDDDATTSRPHKPTNPWDNIDSEKQGFMHQ
jgi:ABC-type transport system involved in multi-copper enzyme maturation permease subunit